MTFARLVGAVPPLGAAGSPAGSVGTMESAGSVGPAIDAVLRTRMGRRAFCAAAASLMGSLAMGCTPSEQQDSNPAGTGGNFGSKPGEDGAATLPSVPAGDPPASQEPVKLSTFAFNSLVSITAYGVGREDVTACFDDCARYEGLFSARKEGTDIARVNAAAGTPVKVDAATFSLLEEALGYCEASGGAFDVTIGAASLLWDFENCVRPSDEAVRAAVGHIDYRRVKLDRERTTVCLEDPLARLDLGGIAKGWILARLTERLQNAGATGALISLATSSICALGTKPDGSAWRLGLRDPRGPLGSYDAIVELSDCCVTSSGLYDQEFEEDGVWYWHILDPATGYPVVTDMVGDTLVGADPVAGDALSTTLFSMGIRKAAEWMQENRGDVAAMIVDQDASADPVFVNDFEQRCGYRPVEAR